MTNGKTYWVCHRHFRSKNLCEIRQIREDAITQAFIRMVNKLKQNSRYILSSALTELMDLKSEISMSDAKVGSINKEKAVALGYEILPGDAWLSQDVDILMPAALENQITAANFPSVSKSVRILCEAANGPTTPDCDPMIRERGIMLIPDFLANAGGVTCSYFEQVQCNMNYFWGAEEVNEKLKYIMTNAFQAVYDLAQEKGLYMRDAAYVIAVNRVVNATKLRGWV